LQCSVLLTYSTWKHEDDQREAQALFAEKLAPSAGEVGVVLIAEK
jgi:hypothetical protein